MRLRILHYFLLSITVLISSSIVKGQVTISAGETKTESFTIGTSATASMPNGWKLDKNTTERTVGDFASAVTVTERSGGDNLATNAGNGIYNFASGDKDIATDRAIGGLSSSTGSKSVNVYLHLTNNGALDIDGLNISYDVEKYRNGSNTAGFSIQMYYSSDGTNWTSAGNDFLTSFSADADNSGYLTAPGSTIAVSNKTLAQSIGASQSLYLAWNYSVSSGSETSNAQALGVDNVSITASNIDLNISNVALNTNPVLAGTSTGISFDLNNTGSLDAGQNTVKYYLSQDGIYDLSDVLLNSTIVETTQASGTKNIEESLVIPDNTSAGSYYILCIADADAEIIELDETNNFASIAVTVNIFGKDLSYESLVMDDVPLNQSINLSYNLTNYGNSTAGKHVVLYYLSDNNNLVVDGTKISTDIIDSVQAGQSLAISKQLNLSQCISEGTHYIKIVIDGETNVSEKDESNNIAVDVFTVSNLKGDLDIYSYSLDKTTVAPNDPVEISYSLQNNTSIALGTSQMNFYLSSDNVLDAGDILIDNVAISALSGCQFTSSLLKVITIPGDTQYGEYYLIAKADANEELNEDDETNNTFLRRIVVSNSPDLIVDAFTIATQSVELGGVLSVDIDVKNISTTGNVGGSNVYYYLSLDNVWDESDLIISSSTSISDINMNSQTGIITDNLVIDNCVAIGSYYIIAKADGGGQINESDETNNTFSLALELIVGDPRISTGYVSSITGSSANVSSTLYCDGGASITEKGVYVGTSENPVVSGTKFVSTDPLSTFTTNATGLLPGTQYYAQSFATNSKGTAYGDLEAFKTDNITITNITNSTAQVNWGHLGIVASSYQIRYNQKYSTEYMYKTSSGSNETILIIPNTTYEVQVRYNTGSWSTYMNPVEFTTSAGSQVLATDVEITNIKANSAEINWIGSGADNYLVFFTESGATDFEYRYSSSSPATIPVKPSSTYTVTVKSLINGQWSAHSAAVDFTSIAGVQQLAENIVISNIGANSADVTWTGSGADKYLVFYTESGATDFEYRYSSSSPATIPVKPSSTYTVTVKSLINGQWSAHSAAVEFTSLAGVQQIAENIVISNIGANLADVTWTASGADKYLVFYTEVGTSNRQYVYSNSSPTTIPVKPSSTYTVTVKSLINGQWSAHSAAVDFTSIAGVQQLAENIVISNIGANSADVTWTGSGADKYLVFYTEVGTTNRQYVYSNSSPTTISVQPLTSYTVTVRSLIGGEWSSHSVPVEFTSLTAPAPPASNISTIGSGKKEENIFEELPKMNVGLIYPNPAKDVVSIDLLLEEPTNIKVSIIDINGRIVKMFDRYVSNQTESFNIEELKTGIYFVKISSINYTETQRLIKE